MMSNVRMKHERRRNKNFAGTGHSDSSVEPPNESGSCHKVTDEMSGSNGVRIFGIGAGILKYSLHRSQFKKKFMEAALAHRAVKGRIEIPQAWENSKIIQARPHGRP
jgi:hypothetical protein